MNNEKELWIELDLYERNHVTVNNLDYISYTKKYVNGFLGERPCFENLSTKLYDKQCQKYIHKLLVLYARVQEKVFLRTPAYFLRRDMINHIIKTLEYTACLKPFISQRFQFKQKMFERINALFIEIEKHDEDIQKIIYSYDFECLKARIIS
jgi:hypothetical protein